MKTLYIHIGTPKTGTTAIQYFCARNQELLASKGYYYPIFPYKYAGKGINRNGLFLTSVYKDENGETNTEEEILRFHEGLAAIRNLFKQYDNIILSDEGIWYAVKKRRKSLWEELRTTAEQDGYTVKIIVYLRRQDDFVASLWNQKIKHTPETITWDEFIHTKNNYANFDYYKTLKRIANILGKENLIVRRYDRDLLKGGLTQMDFLDVLGLEMTDEYELNQPVRNSSLSLNGCEIKRIVNRLADIRPNENLFFQNALVKTVNESNSEYPSTIWNPAERHAFNDIFSNDNQKISKQFICDGKPLFHEYSDNSETWQRDNPHMENDIIRFSAGCDIVLLREIQTLREQFTTENQTLQTKLSAMQEEINILRQFRMKIKHPFKTAVKKLSRQTDNIQ